MNTLLAILVLLAFLGTILGLFIPAKVGFFLKKRTHLRVFGCYFVILVVALNLFTLTAPDKVDSPEALQDEVVVVTEPDSFEILAYSLEREEDTSISLRNRKTYSIILAESNAEKINPDNLLATVVSAAKYLADDSGAEVVTVALYDQKGENWGQTRLATIAYSPDGLGHSGKQDWTWDQPGTSARTTTDLEKQIAKAWNEMREDFQASDGTGTDEEKLKGAIAEKLNIEVEQVTLPYLMMEKATVDYNDVKATKPTN